MINLNIDLVLQTVLWPYAPDSSAFSIFSAQEITATQHAKIRATFNSCRLQLLHLLFFRLFIYAVAFRNISV